MSLLSVGMLTQAATIPETAIFTCTLLQVCHIKDPSVSLVKLMQKPQLKQAGLAVSPCNGDCICNGFSRGE